MRYSTVLVSLAASAAALPTVSKRSSVYDVSEPAPVCERFTVAFNLFNNQIVTANAVKNGTATDLVLEAERPAAYPGTEAYFNYSNPNPDPNFDYIALNFVLDDGVYGAFAADVGDSYGLALPINLVKGEQQFEWTTKNGSIGHKLFAAPNGLYSCNRSLVGQSYNNFFLSFGDYDFGGAVTGPPAGCTTTNVQQSFVVSGGLTGPADADADDDGNDDDDDDDN